jgi:hypothetical protein
MQPLINLRGQHPVQNNERAIACQNIREIGAQRIADLGPLYDIFLIKYVDDFNKVTDIEIDWEFCLFRATMFQFRQLFIKFQVAKGEPVKVKPKYTGKKKL